MYNHVLVWLVNILLARDLLVKVSLSFRKMAKLHFARKDPMRLCGWRVGKPRTSAGSRERRRRRDGNVTGRAEVPY
jgi:hypothetical protein